jgi:hypothetical protein
MDLSAILLKWKATLIQRGKHVVLECPFCLYKCGYVYDEHGFGYDSGCYCTRNSPNIHSVDDSDMILFMSMNKELVIQYINEN